jgi:hypothetical protein
MDFNWRRHKSTVWYLTNLLYSKSKAVAPMAAAAAAARLPARAVVAGRGAATRRTPLTDARSCRPAQRRSPEEGGARRKTESFEWDWKLIAWV